MPDQSSILTVQYGLYFGECVGYCIESVLISLEEIVYTKRSNISNDELPDRVLKTETSSDFWERFSRTLDLNVIRDLPDQLGKPDVADQGGEYVEIRTTEELKRVEFEYHASVSGLDSALEILRSLRSDLAAQMED